MSTFKSNISYKLRYHSNWAAWHLGIYIPLIVLTFGILIGTGVINSSDGSLVYRLWVSVFFLFAISTRFKEDFDFFLTMSSTRRDIYLTMAGFPLLMGAFFSVLIVLEKVLVDQLNPALGLNSISDPFHLIAPYNTGNLLLIFIFFLALNSFVTQIGLLVGSLCYRWGKKFALTFWLIFSLTPTLFIPLLLWYFHSIGHLQKSLNATGHFFQSFNVPAAIFILFSLTILFSGVAYVNIRRLAQR